MIIGITGGTGCGKTTLLEHIRNAGGMIIDCDRVYHDLLAHDADLAGAIAARFPDAVQNGIVERKILGQIVFNDDAALLELNTITHSAVKKQVLKLLSEKPALAAIDAIGLLESGLAALCDVTVAVTAPDEMRAARIVARDGVSSQYALARIRAQKDQQYYVAHCTYHLENNATIEEFSKKCIAFLHQLGIITAK